MANVLGIGYSVVCLGSKTKYSFSGHLGSLLGSFSPTNRGFLAVFPQPIEASWQPSWQFFPNQLGLLGSFFGLLGSLLVGEKLPRCPEKLPRRLPRCPEKLPRSPYWSRKSCQEGRQGAQKSYQEVPIIGQGKAAKKAAKMPGKATKKPLFISLPKQTIL